MQPTKYIFQQPQCLHVYVDGRLVEVRDYRNPNRGRIRRALAYIGGAFLGVAMLWALCWGMAIACVAAGGSIEVCGL